MLVGIPVGMRIDGPSPASAIVSWEMSPDIRGELAGSERLEYWRLNREGHESYLKKLGL